MLAIERLHAPEHYIFEKTKEALRQTKPRLSYCRFANPLKPQFIRDFWDRIARLKNELSKTDKYQCNY